MEVSIHHADTGETFVLHFQTLDALSVDELKKQASEYSNIPVKNMIMIYGTPPHNRVEVKKKVVSNEVFVYNKTLLLKKKSSFSQSSTTPTTSQTMNNSSSHSTISVEEDEDRTFSLTALRTEDTPTIYVENICFRSGLRWEAFESLALRCQVQIRAAGVAVGNLLLNFTSLLRMYDSFRNGNDDLLALYNRITDTLDQDISNLSNVKLAKKKNGNNNAIVSLADALPIAKINKWGSEIKRQHSVIQTKTTELDGLMKLVQNNCASEDVSMKAEEEAIVGKLEEYKTAAKALHETLQSQCGVFDVHANNNMDAIKATEAKFVETSKRLSEVKSQTQRALLSRLRNVSLLESKIESLSNTMAALKQGASVQETLLRQIEFVKHVPASYVAAVMEAERRRSFDGKYMAFVQECADRISEMRDRELKTREAFLHKHVNYLPNNLVPGIFLNDSFPACEITQRPVDELLFQTALSFDAPPSADVSAPAKQEEEEEEEMLLLSNNNARDEEAEEIHQLQLKIQELEKALQSLEGKKQEPAHD